MNAAKDLRQLHNQSGRDAVAALLDDDENFEPYEPPAAPRPEVLPLIQLPQPGFVLQSDFASKLGQHLAGAGLFRMGGIAVTLNESGDATQVMDPFSFRTWAERHVVCYTAREREGTVISLRSSMGGETARTVLAASQFLEALPQIDKLNPCRMPVIRASGALELLPLGYDAEARVFTTGAGIRYRRMSATEARDVIERLLGEFPFASDGGRSKAVAVAAMFSAFCRGMLPAGSIVPAFFYLANAEGAGKTTLAQCALAPVFGRAEARSLGNDDGELRKELLTAVMEGGQFLLLDNLKGHVSSPTLEAFLTAPTWEGRVLRVSRTFRGPNHCAVFLTGNGCTVSPDLRRRSLFSELFMTEERAEERKFSQTLDLPAILAQRAEILSALWTLVQSWDEVGRPSSSIGNASFPRWAEVIGGIVESSGWGNPCAAAQIEGAGDRDGQDMRALVLSMPEGEALTFGELIALASERGLFETLIPSSGELDAKAKSLLGKLLSRYGGRIFGGKMRFTIEGKGHGRRYRATKAG